MTEKPEYESHLPVDSVASPKGETPEELRQRRLRDTITMNRYLYRQSEQMTRMLLGTSELQALLEVLLVNFPRHFGFVTAELWLYDPEGVLRGLLVDVERHAPYLQLHSDAFVMQELYELEPDVKLVAATDRSMFEILKSDQRVEQALMMPLMDEGRLIGSLHCGMIEPAFTYGEEEESLMAQMADIISLCFRNAVSRQQISRLTLLDPLTQISNLRGFEKDITREIARARRADQPLSVLMLEIDEYQELEDHYGSVTGKFTLRKVTERLTSDLRTTDYLARLGGARFAILLPGAGEAIAGDIAERVRRDIESFSIDDGRGANLQVSVSVGYVCWEPQRFPAVDMVQLARQIEAAATKGLESAAADGGNRTSVSRLTTLMV